MLRVTSFQCQVECILKSSVFYSFMGSSGLEVQYFLIEIMQVIYEGDNKAAVSTRFLS